MKIFVPVKRVVDYNVKVRVKSDNTGVDIAKRRPYTFERPIYAGNAIATVQSLDEKKVITVRTTGFEPAAATGGSAAVETATAVADAGKSKFEGSEIAKNDRPELTAAKIIVSGGRALGSSGKFNEVVTPLAGKVGTALGASRAAVATSLRRMGRERRG